MAKLGKTHQFTSWQFDALMFEAFDNVASVGAGAANTTVQARLPIPQRCKIAKIVANYSAVGTGGAHSINIVVGTGAEGTVPVEIEPGTVDPVAVAGTVVFTADQAIQVAGADVPTQLIPTRPDVVYNTGALLTLRCVTPGATGSFTNLKVGLCMAPVDVAPQFPSGTPAAATANVAGSSPASTTGEPWPGW
jgi:hypothetical protein